jgi:hypothetical protein
MPISSSPKSRLTAATTAALGKELVRTSAVWGVGAVAAGALPEADVDLKHEISP